MGEIVSNVPRPVSSFVGRRAEVAQVAAAMRSGARLLTLVGPGGVGKTRLALRVADELERDYANGVVFVGLASVADASLVSLTVAQALGIRDGQDDMGPRIASYLAGRQLLLVIDNFEHVLDAAEVVSDALAAGPQVAVVATSRIPLHLSGERVVQLAPLRVPATPATLTPATVTPATATPATATPATAAPVSLSSAELDVDALADTDAVQLFVARASAVRSDFALTAENAGAVGAICARVDGLPLAIELAAARVRSMDPKTLLDRLAPRLPVLSGGARDQPARQQSMGGAIAWSYDLLDAPAQRMFRRLGVFAGGFDDEAVRAIAQLTEPDRDTLTRLIDASLIQPDHGGRHTMLETIREFALERLDETGESEAIRLLHAEHFADLARRGDIALRGHGQHEWLARFEREHDNFRSALRWSCDRGLGDMASRMAGSLYWFWTLHSHFSEGRRWLEAALALRPSRASEVQALLGLGVLAYNQTDYDTALVRLNECVDMGRLIGMMSDVARALQFLAVLAFRQARYADAHALAQQSLSVARAEGDDWAAAGALCVLGFESPGMIEADARELLEEAEAISRRLGDSWGVARAANTLGEYARGRSDWASATRLYETALERYRMLGTENGAALVMYNLGCVAQQSNDSAAAARWLADALRIHSEREDQRGIAHCLAGLAGAIAVLGEPGIAARFLGTAERMFELANTTRDPVDQVLYEADVALVRDALDSSSFRAAWQAGRVAAFDDAVRDALRAVENLGVVKTAFDAGAPGSSPVPSTTDQDGLS